MTNYNERLDEILDKFGWTCVANGGDGYGLQNEDISEAKQAIRQLMKELVAEAKPQEHIDVYTYSNAKTNDDIRKIAINQFEQNLLKALEEV